jgi:hypothetical protein
MLGIEWKSLLSLIEDNLATLIVLMHLYLLNWHSRRLQ